MQHRHGCYRFTAYTSSIPAFLFPNVMTQSVPSNLLDKLSLLTRLQGSPLSAHALAAQTLRNEAGRPDLHSLREVLLSHGYENQLSERALLEVPALAVPLLVLTTDGDAQLVSEIQGEGTQRSYTLMEQDGSTRTVSHAELDARYLGYCWFIKMKPEQDNRSELPEYTMGKAWFWKVIWRFRNYSSQVVLATVLINVLALIGSLYVMNVYDRVIPNKGYETLWVLSIGVLLANLFEFIARTLRARLTDIAGKKADLIISSALFRRVMSLDLTQKPASSGSYANNLRDFESVRDFMTSASLLVLIDLPFVLLFVFVMSMVSGRLAFVPLLTIPIVVLAGLLAQRPLARSINASMKESSQRQGLAVEAIEGIETLKANNATNWAQQRWERFTASTASASMKQKDISNLVVNFSMLVQQANTVLLVLWGTYLIHHEDPAVRITMGALIATVILSGRALSPLSQVAGLMIRFQQARMALQGINQVVERKTERDHARSYISPTHIRGDLAFDNVSFHYGEQGPDVCKEMRFQIKAGERVGVLGRIGSGKSTMLRLAAGLYEPQKGNVLLDSMDVRQIDPTDVRNHVSLLSQQPRLFLGSLRENLEMGRMDRLSTDEELVAALQRFGLEAIVRAHPMGLNMPLGEDGAGLSGGQRQLVGLSRMTLRDPRVVLLDEPTSGLDQMTEMAALRGIADWVGKSKRTMVVVTHRPQVLNIVDRIIVVDHGKIIMDGPRDAVLQRLAANEREAQQQAQQRTAGQQVTASMQPAGAGQQVTATVQPAAPAADAAAAPAQRVVVGRRADGSIAKAQVRVQQVTTAPAVTDEAADAAAPVTSDKNPTPTGN